MLAFFNDVGPGGHESAPENSAAQYFGTKGCFPGFDGRLDQIIHAEEAERWTTADCNGLAGTPAARELAEELGARGSAREESARPITGARPTRRDAMLREWRKLLETDLQDL
jgi:hypothetical protein